MAGIPEMWRNQGMKTEAIPPEIKLQLIRACLLHNQESSPYLNPKYIKALKTEYQNLLDKPILERLDRLIEPMEKLQSSTIANSKPPVHPSRNPSPRKTRTPVRNKIAEGDQKPNCTPTDACLKKTKLRPKTTPNKARDATVPQRGLTATIAAESSKNKMKNGNCAQDVVGRPVTVSADHQRQGSRVSSAPSHSGDRENGPSQLDGLAKVQVGSPLPTVHECEQSGRKRSQSSGEPVRLGLAASEGNAGERESYECLRNHSLIDNLEDEPLPSKRLRARSCIRRKEKIRPRRRRFTTCCFPLMPNPKYFLTDSFMSNNSEEPKTLTDSKKQYADASVNVSLTLKSENMDASVQKTEEVLVNSSQEGNNQIIFNVYQMTPENLASDRKDECSDRKGQLREEDGEATLRLEEDTSNATSQDHVEEGSCKSHVEILERPGMTDIRGYYPCSSPIYTTGGACGEGGPNRSQIEEPSPKRYVALPRRQDGRNLGELWGNGERLVLTTELPQYVPCQGHLGSLGKGRLPFPVRNVVCECCGRDGTSNVSQVFTSFSYAEPRTVSSAPSLEVSDSHRELCVECRRIMKTLPKLKIRKGRPLLRPLKESSSKIPHSREPVRCQGKCREESVHLSQPLGDLSLGVVRDWLRDSNVDLRRWSSELTVKVDVGTSVSGFHVANLYSGGTRINREAKCATDMEVDRKDVACSAKTSSVTVILEKKYFKLGQCMTKEVTPKKRSKVTPVRTLARVPNTRRRKILVMSGVYVCLFTFFGWVLLLPSYYIK
ncbi:uncharacterized protein LOC124167375 isoform X2 [Ischnura elegans]|uniref:uncharacterized protein LOC124167375 isoform X2 n=2 Tax=Ischnura elegans TaxID=197161 RepID=UPI001ED8A9B3|nr:uncharacterized protein LOC124167375 isoform X2 [Ischnura elegans]